MDETIGIICRELAFLCSDGRLNIWFFISIIPFLGIIFGLTMIVGYEAEGYTAISIVPLTVVVSSALSLFLWIILTGAIRLWIESETFRIIALACGFFLMIGYGAFVFSWVRERNRGVVEFNPPTNDIRGDTTYSYMERPKADEGDEGIS